MGAPREDYERVAPPSSFIHVNDFTSRGDLAEYLKHLHLNDNQYLQYFEWKKYGTMVNSKPWCRLCGLLNTDDKEERFYRDVDRWWRKGASDKGQVWQWVPAYRNYDLTSQQLDEEKDYTSFASDEMHTKFSP